MCFCQPMNEAWLEVIPPDVLARLLASTNESDLNILSLLLQYHTVPSPLLSQVCAPSVSKTLIASGAAAVQQMTKSA